MRKNIFLIGFLLAGSMGLSGYVLPRGIRQKVEKEVERTFEVTDFSLEALTISEQVNEGLPLHINGDNFFRIQKGSALLGYAFVDQAPSKTAVFDYLVLFNPSLQVIHSKILVYREEYGGEIGSRRWLRQFDGLTGRDRVGMNGNIDAISGATISARSMTRSMDILLQTIGKLQENHVLP